MSENKVEFIKNDILDEGYYSIDHKSGLKIYVYPKAEYTSTYAVFGTKYGSIDTRFKRSDKKDFIEIPAGTAHFLEHKLFESEETVIENAKFVVVDEENLVGPELNVLTELGKAIKPGMSTLDIDRLGEEMIRSYGCEPSFLNYCGYPASICVS